MQTKFRDINEKVIRGGFSRYPSYPFHVNKNLLNAIINWSIQFLE